MADDETGLKPQIRELIQSAIKEFCEKNGWRYSQSTELSLGSVSREKCNLEYRNHGSRHFHISVRCFVIEEDQIVTVYFLPNSYFGVHQRASKFQIDDTFESLAETHPGIFSHTVQFYLQEALTKEETALEKDRIKK